MNKKPADCKNFLTNGQNKSHLVDVMNEVWSSVSFAPKHREVNAARVAILNHNM